MPQRNTLNYWEIRQELCYKHCQQALLSHEDKNGQTDKYVTTII